MKIFFVPYYFYIHYDLFNDLKNKFNKNVKSFLLYIPNMLAKNELATYNKKKFKKDNFNYIKFNLLKFNLGLKLLSHFLQGICFYINYYKLKKLFKHEKPNAVVIGSNLGGIYIRLIQKICYAMSIPVFSYWDSKQFVDPVCPYKLKYFPKFLKKVFFMEDILNWAFNNKYTDNILFLTANNKTKMQLMGFGVDENRITVSGHLKYDIAYHQLRKESKADIKKDTIVVVTEVIHEVLGIDFLKTYVNVLSKILRSVSFKMKVVIKFHPRETESTKNIYREAFVQNNNCIYVEKMDVHDLYEDALFAVGMYSQILETALLLKIPVLVLNLTKESKYSIYKYSSSCSEYSSTSLNLRSEYPGFAEYSESNLLAHEDKYNELICTDECNFKLKIDKLINDASFYDRAKDLIQDWVNENVFEFNGENIKKAAANILLQTEKYYSYEKVVLQETTI